MKKIDYKTLIITCIFCLLPILLGISLYDRLSPEIAIHFDIHNTPDNYTSKAVAVFGLPVFMMLLQIVCCVISDINADKKGHQPKIEKILKCIVPFITVVVYIATLLYDLEKDVDIRRIACFLVGIIFIMVGNYLPKINYKNNMGFHTMSFIKDEFIQKKICRLSGYGFVVLGILVLVSLFFPPIVSAAVIILTPVFCILTFIYAVWLYNHEFPNSPS